MYWVKCLSIIIVLLCSACSSTNNKVSYQNKRVLVSDHHLMMSLLDRPITHDQKIMLAFANYQEQLQHTLSTPVLVRPIAIVGNEEQTERNAMPNYYQTLIAKDLHSARISGPQ